MTQSRSDNASKTVAFVSPERRPALAGWLAAIGQAGATLHLDSAETLQEANEAGLLIFDLSAFPIHHTDRDEFGGIAMDSNQRAPIVSIVDLDSLDELGPLLTVPNLEFVMWSEIQEGRMPALEVSAANRHVGVDGIADEQQPYETSKLEDLQLEVERVARALARLAKTQGDARSKPRKMRAPADSVGMIRTIIQRRRARSEFFAAELFADPAWDILLDLAAARHEGIQVSISSLCIAANVPTTTGLRWIKGLTEAGLLIRIPDPSDGRRSFITLSTETAERMERYLDEVEDL